MATYFNPSDKGSQASLSENDSRLTVVNAVWEGARFVNPVTGKKYWEGKIISGTETYVVGVCSSTRALSGAGVITETGAVKYRNNGQVYLDGAVSATINTYTSSDVIGIAVDVPNSKVWFSKNNVWDGDPVAGTGGYTISWTGDVYPFAIVYSSSSKVYGQDIGDNATYYQPPEGFNKLFSDYGDAREFILASQTSTISRNTSFGLTTQALTLSVAVNVPAAEYTLTINPPEYFPNLNFFEIGTLVSSFSVHDPVSVLFDWPAFVGEAIATVSNNTALFQWPAFEGSAHAGAQVLFDWPAIEGDASATNPGFATALFDWPAFGGEATAFTGQVANATFNWPGFAGEAYSGGTVLFDWPTFEGDGAATVGAVANALFDWPAIEGESSATVFGTASALFDWPAFEGEAGDGIHVLFDWPAFAGAASVTHAVVIADAETYAVNLSSGAVTRLLLGPLDKLVTAYGKLYALRDGELLVLAGNNDGVDEGVPIPIPATVRFAQQDFGILNAKRCHAVYLNAREDDGLTLDIVEDERTTWRYQTPTDTAPAMGTHRVKTGRGLKFHTLGVVVQNRNGGRLDIGGMELLVQPLVPRPKTS